MIKAIILLLVILVGLNIYSQDYKIIDDVNQNKLLFLHKDKIKKEINYESFKDKILKTNGPSDGFTYTKVIAIDNKVAILYYCTHIGPYEDTTNKYDIYNYKGELIISGKDFHPLFYYYPEKEYILLAYINKFRFQNNQKFKNIIAIYNLAGKLKEKIETNLLDIEVSDDYYNSYLMYYPYTDLFLKEIKKYFISTNGELLIINLSNLEKTIIPYNILNYVNITEDSVSLEVKNIELFNAILKIELFFSNHPDSYFLNIYFDIINNNIFDIDKIKAFQDKNTYPKAISINATSYIDWKNKYIPLVIFDGKPETGWLENKEGPGINEVITLKLDRKIAIDKIKIMPGYFDAKWWKANNRIKKLKIMYESQSLIAKFSNEMKRQTVKLPEVISFSEITFEILDIYPSNKDNDTGISEIEFFINDEKIIIDLSGLN